MLFGIVHKLSIGFAIVGVINGVIMQETFKVAATDDVIMVRQKRRAAEVSKRKMSTLFNALDTSGQGNLEYAEFGIIAQDPEVMTWLSSMDIETDDLKTLFKLIDVDNSGSISIDELISRVPRIRGSARSIDVLALRRRMNEVASILNSHTEGFHKVAPHLNLPSLDQERVNLGGFHNVVPEVHTLKGINAIGGNMRIT